MLRRENKNSLKIQETTASSENATKIKPSNEHKLLPKHVLVSTGILEIFSFSFNFVIARTYLLESSSITFKYGQVGFM